MAVRKKAGAKRKSKQAVKKAGRKSVVKKTAHKTAAKKSAAKRLPAKKRPAKKAASKKTAGKKASAKRSSGKKPSRKATPAKTAKSSSKRRGALAKKPAAGKTAAPRPAAAPAPLAASAAPPRKPARKAARRAPAVRTSEPRTVGVRKVGVRTAVLHETSRTPRLATVRKPGKTALAELVRVEARKIDRQDALLTPEALEFLALLHRQFDGRRLSLLARRHERQARLDAGELPDFLHETRHVRSSGWRVTGVPGDLLGHQDEVIIAPDPMAIATALQTGAGRVVVDFEEAAPPSWDRVMTGHLAMLDHWTAASGTTPAPALIVRPRGWHLPEAHVFLGADAMSGSLFDFGMVLFHTAVRQMELGTRPTLCLPKLESYLEARLWSDVLTFAERHLGLPRGSCKVTVQIETLPAAFEMDEIVFELREHIAGLALAPRGLVASMIKRLGIHVPFLMPERAQIEFDKGFLAAVADRLARTCQRRGIAALGVPRPDDRGGAPSGAQLEEGRPVRDALIASPTGGRTLAGLQDSVALAVHHLAGWLEGGAAADPAGPAEAEIARALVWQWIRLGANLDDGELVTPTLVRALIDREIEALGGRPQAAIAGQMFFDSVTVPDCAERLTLLAYRQLIDAER